MYLKNVFVRFYRSFNFDYLRKYDHKVGAKYDWEILEEYLWYPFIKIPVDEKITTVVGANESGKTHLLTAIEKGLSGEDIARSDFCRYSQFFAVEQGKMRWPDFGFEWDGLTQEESEAVASTCENLTDRFDRFLMFRTLKTKVTVYVPDAQSSKYSAHTVARSSELLQKLPPVFRLQENVALPESVPIRFLAGEQRASQGLESLPRQKRVGLLESIWTNMNWFKTKESVTQSAEPIAREMSRFSTATEDSRTVKARVAELDLARDLIRKVARIDPEALNELYTALREGRDAFANSLIDGINDELQAKLNFPNWWVQDREFRLLVSPRECDLVFTIRDRTDTEYAFGERSSGLRYFLSYYIQYLAHERRADRPEILLMDEPDAFLSNQGQQDLLKIFDAFSNPEDGSAPIQLIYVTHSPFLIDKNHGERIRVLEKGVGEEGTRVVRDASRNHYEPLRSAFGSFVGETTFIGNCNLIVEGPSDQILLAGAAIHLRGTGASEVETLDLNHITIVPASGASHVPYLVYLARGRDVDKPAVIVMLDSDGGGDAAKKGLLKGGPNRKELLKPSYILQVGTLSAETPVRRPNGNSLVETEDFIPIQICVEAARRYIRDVCAADAGVVERITADTITAEIIEGRGIFHSIEDGLRKISDELHIEKIGFARAVIEIVADFRRRARDDNEAAEALSQFETNMKTLFRRLRQMQREAERELTSVRVSARVNRAKSSFIQDHPVSAKRENVYVLFEDIESALDNSEEADEIERAIQSLRRDFKIDDQLSEPVEDYGKFLERLESVRYAGRLATQEPILQEAGALTDRTEEFFLPSADNPVVDESTAPPKLAERSASTPTALAAGEE